MSSSQQHRFYVITGTSGAGKTIALQALEDVGCYCIDNLPANLLVPFAQSIGSEPTVGPAAVSIDARNPQPITAIEAELQLLTSLGVKPQLIFLDASDSALLTRYSETRRKHPLTDQDTALSEAISKERDLLAPLARIADLKIDTSQMTPHELRSAIREDLGGTEHDCTVLLQSFGFKYGPPGEADFVFDVRCLPNPHWHPELQPLSGRDHGVIEFLDAEPDCQQMIDHIGNFLSHWVPKFIDDNRSYITIAVGCTGGRHRSVFCVERLAQQLSANRAINYLVRHRDLSLPSIGNPASVHAELSATS